MSLREWNSPNMQRKGIGGQKPLEPVSRFECSARVESQPLDDSDSVVVLLTPDLNGKAFVPRRIELTEGSEVQVKPKLVLSIFLCFNHLLWSFTFLREQI